jgi:hypothetical protein
LSASHLDFGDIKVRNDTDYEIPGQIIRFIQSDAGLSVIVVAPPAPHATIVVGHADEGVDAARSAIATSMTSLGLLPSEAEAFLRSWEGQLFGLSEERPVAGEILPVTEESSPVRTTLLYFLPTELTDRVSRLSFSPPPVATRRALAVWTAP